MASSSPSAVPPPSPRPLRVDRQLSYNVPPSRALLPSNASILAIAQAPFTTDRVENTSFLVYAEEFFEDNPLIAATLQPRTQQRYAVALENFRDSPFSSDSHHLPLDHRLYLYIQDAFLQNPRPRNRQEMTNLLCMISIMFPSLRGAYLGLSKRCISGWRALRPARSSTPFTKDLVLVLTFFACLRASEALALRTRDIALPGDALIAAYGPNVAGFNVRDAKTAHYTGQLQFVKLDDPDAIGFVKAWIATLNRSDTTLLNLSYQTYASELKTALASLSLHQANFTTHSARIGKATQDYILGLPVDQIAINGRWKSLNSLRYYVTNGRAWLLDTNMSTAAQAGVRAAARQMNLLLRAVPDETLRAPQLG